MDQTNQISFVKSFNSTRAKVWQAWTLPEHVAMWWGPENITTEVVQLDLKVGGLWLYTLRDSQNIEYQVEGVFTAVVPEQQIITTDGYTRALRAQNPNLPQPALTYYTFADSAAGTDVTIQILHKTPEDKEKHLQLHVVDSWSSSLLKLERYLANV